MRRVEAQGGDGRGEGKQREGGRSKKTTVTIYIGSAQRQNFLFALIRTILIQGLKMFLVSETRLCICMFSEPVACDGKSKLDMEREDHGQRGEVSQNCDSTEKKKRGCQRLRLWTLQGTMLRRNGATPTGCNSDAQSEGQRPVLVACPPLGEATTKQSKSTS